MPERFTVLLATLLVAAPALAQNQFRGFPEPSADAIQQADAMVDTVFTALEEGRTQDLADWLGDQILYAADASTRVQQINNYKSQLDILLIPPPSGAHGPIDGRDLLEEAVLPGSDRYFRRTYIVYHDGAPLVWELRFYVRPNGQVSLNAFQFNPGNPFEYLATPDMLLNSWRN